MALIRETGLANTAKYSAGLNPPGVNTHQMSTGNMLLVIKDENLSTANKGEKNNIAKLYVYEYNPSTDVSTLRATISAPTDGINVYESLLHPNNDLSIVVRASTGKRLSHVKVTNGTWGVSAWETIASGLAGVVGYFTLAGAIQGGIVGIAYTYYAGTTLTAAVQFRSSAGAWSAATTIITGYTSGARSTRGESIALGIMRGELDGSATTVNFVVALGASTTTTDFGVKIASARLTVATRAITSITVRKTFANGTITNATASRSMLLHNIKSLDGFESYSYTLLVGQIDNGRVRVFVDTGVWYGTFWAGDGVPASYLLPATVVGLTTYGMAFSPGHWDATGIFHFIRQTSAGRVHYSVIRPESSGNTWLEGNWDFGNLNALWMGSQGQSNVEVPNTGTGGKIATLTYVNRTASGVSFVAAEISIVPNPNRADGSTAITSLTPADGAEEVSSTPSLWVLFTVTDAMKLSPVGAQWQLSQDPTFTTGVKNFSQDYVNISPSVGSGGAFMYSIKAANKLGGGAWYMRARLMSLLGDAGVWSSTTIFSVGHPPRSIPISPIDSMIFAYDPLGTIFSWRMTDPYAEDYQTAYQIQVVDSSPGATWTYDTGKVLAASQTASIVIPSAQKAHLLAWRIRLWDSLDSPGVYSEYTPFSVADAPQVEWEFDYVPTPVKEIVTGTPALTANVTQAQGLAIAKIEFEVTKAGELVYYWIDSGDYTSPITRTLAVPPNLLENNENYTFTVRAHCFGGLGVVKTVPVYTNWPKPAPPSLVTVDGTPFGQDGYGYVDVSWETDLAESEFFKWVVSRADIPLNADGTPDGSVDTPPKIVYESFDSSGTISFQDFFAPSGHLVVYLVQQVSITNGHLRSGDYSDAGFAAISSDGYHLIEVSEDRMTATVFKLHNVTGDSFTDETEEFEYQILGRGRAFQKGDRLGNKGTLDAQLRNSGGTTARKKRLRLIEVQSHDRDLWLRNPFGDIFRVNVSSMSVARIAGVGTSEFCDVQIPYAEVME